MFVCHAGFYVNYRASDKETMFLPTFLIWALWMGLGYDRLLAWMTQEQDPALRRWGTWLVRAAAVGAVLVAVAWNWPVVDLSDDWSTRVRGETVLEVVEPNSLVLAWWDTVPVVEYLQLVEGQRPDVEAINRFLIGDEDMLSLIEEEMDRRAVYVDRANGQLLRMTRIEAEGPLYRLRPRH
jgi:hypothetical protein